MAAPAMLHPVLATEKVNTSSRIMTERNERFMAPQDRDEMVDSKAHFVAMRNGGELVGHLSPSIYLD
jgi:hypothetical protein